ncbi:MAG: PaaI family thioesterase [Novosphingobium sp.]|nr:PaaI family thioesterase [Novosphingobium sp.]
MPEGYVYEPTPAPFIEHVGKIYMKDVTQPDGVVEKWSAIRIEPHQVNAWNFAHGGLLATMAEVGTATAGWDPDGPPCVAVDLSIQFIGAPKLGEILEVCGTLTKRTRSMIFTAARGEVDGNPVLFATSIQKIVGV